MQPLVGQQKNISIGEINIESTYVTAERYALVIGNDHYRSKDISSLSSCRLDALRYASFLESDASWKLPKKNIRLLLDANGQSIKDSLLSILDRMKDSPESIFYFYYSGHGIQGGIVPIDYNKDKSETLLSYSWIKDEINRRRIKNQVFIIDACYSGSIIKMKGQNSNTALFSAALSTEIDNSQSVVLTAANAYRVTPAGRHESLYSRHLLKALNSNKTDIDGNGILTAGELFKSISKNLESVTSPQFAGNINFPMSNLVNSNSSLTAAILLNQSNRDMMMPASKTSNSLVKQHHDLIKWRQQLEEKYTSFVSHEDIISKLKTKNTAESNAKLGFLYREGIGVEKNVNEALKYFITAASEENSFAQYNLGYLYDKGIGMKRNEEKAITMYIKAAEKGNPFAENNLGVIYSNTDYKSVSQDNQKALEWFVRAANQGYTRSQFALSQIYYKKANWTVDTTLKKAYYQKAIKWLMLAAETGFAKAQYQLAGYLQAGKGIKINLEQSKYWYKKACANDMLQSCRKLMILSNL